MIFTYRYCRMLEEGSFRGRTADFIYMFIFGCISTVVIFERKKKTFLSYKFLLFIFPDLCLVCQFTLPRTLTYNHACICVGKAKSICQNELFWPLTISCKYYIVIDTQSHKILTALKIYCRLPIYLGYLLLSQCYWATVC